MLLTGSPISNMVIWLPTGEGLLCAVEPCYSKPLNISYFGIAAKTCGTD